MQVIVPLAGPDLVSGSSFRPLTPYRNQPLIAQILKSRAWFQSGEVKGSDHIFVVRAVERIETLVEFLRSEFEGCRVATIDELTAGALCTALAGASLVKNFNEAICIDLADIDYATDFSPTQFFGSRKDIYGQLLTFKSNNPKYSYLKLEGENVVECVEKRVISDLASAGTYFYRDLASFLFAATESIKFKDEVSFKDALFVCPSFTFFSRVEKKVSYQPVELIYSMSEIFKN